MSKRKSTKPRILVLGGGVPKQLREAGAEQVSLWYDDQKAVEAAKHKNIHAIILTGGSDIQPRIYGQEPHKATQRPSYRRDLIELQVLQAAQTRGIPVLGICRGAQLINAAFGGTLHQHLGDLKQAHSYHLGHDHRVKVVRGSRLLKTLKNNTPWVVSIHHQAVDKVAPGFRVVARGTDGIIEAIESKEGYILGVQFHPEIATNKMMQRVFDDLAVAAAEVAGLPAPVKPAPVVQVAAPVRVVSPDRQLVPFDDRLITWQCFRCGLEFDDRVDHVDHMFFLHGIDLLDNMTDDEVFRLVGED